MKNGAISGLGSTLSYRGREYISVTMFSGFVNQLFFSCTGTSGISSSVGVPCLPRTAVFRQERAHCALPFRRDPALEKQHRFIRQDIPGAPLLGRLGRSRLA